MSLFLLEIKSRSLSVYDVSKSLLKIRYSRFHNIITRDGFVSFVTLYSVQFTLSTQLIKESHLMRNQPLKSDALNKTSYKWIIWTHLQMKEMYRNWKGEIRIIPCTRFKICIPCLLQPAYECTIELENKQKGRDSIHFPENFHRQKSTLRYFTN